MSWAHLTLLPRSKDLGSVVTLCPSPPEGDPCPGNPLLSPRVGWAVPRAQRLGVPCWLWSLLPVDGWCSGMETLC